jgi:2,4-dienoyl-CoA reductase-like NADH-dependent reductase (Old Yellow Enzyme family)
MTLEIQKPFTLPSGLVLPNRLVKAAMAEAMAGPATDYLPNDAMKRSYSAWADGGWGMIMTGNVQVNTKFLGQPQDPSVIDDEAKQLESWRAWAKAVKGRNGSTPAVVQINHPGRQSPAFAGTKGFFTKNMAPSPIPLSLGPGLLARMVSALVMGTPREMTVADIEEVVGQFARAARLSADAGFDGVELHAAHGYLLSLFLSPKSNKRTDAYGGSAQKSARIVADIIRAAREATPKGFTIGIKLNSVDHQSTSDLEYCIEQIRVITEAGIDFLEVSGGSYEDPMVSVISHHRFVIVMSGRQNILTAQPFE